MPPRNRLDPYQRVWDEFQRSETTDDGRHDTLQWRSHAGPYAACVARIPVESLQPKLDSLRCDLAHLSGVRLHPNHFLHIMLQELGFVTEAPEQPDEISGARLEEFAQASAGAIFSLPPFTIALGGANSFQDAVFLDVQHGEPLTIVHERLFDLAAIPSIPEYTYLPHCTIAHYDGSTLTRDAVTVLAAWRDAICGEWTVTEVEIVTLDPSEPYPQLETYAAIPLRI